MKTTSTIRLKTAAALAVALLLAVNCTALDGQTSASGPEKQKSISERLAARLETRIKLCDSMLKLAGGQYKAGSLAGNEIQQLREKRDLAKFALLRAKAGHSIRRGPAAQLIRCFYAHIRQQEILRRQGAGSNISTRNFWPMTLVDLAENGAALEYLEALKQCKHPGAMVEMEKEILNKTSTPLTDGELEKLFRAEQQAD